MCLDNGGHFTLCGPDKEQPFVIIFGIVINSKSEPVEEIRQSASILVTEMKLLRTYFPIMISMALSTLLGLRPSPYDTRVAKCEFEKLELCWIKL